MKRLKVLCDGFGPGYPRHVFSVVLSPGLHTRSRGSCSASLHPRFLTARPVIVTSRSTAERFNGMEQVFDNPWPLGQRRKLLLLTLHTAVRFVSL